jgi:allophanate hydrolase
MGAARTDVALLCLADRLHRSLSPALGGLGMPVSETPALQVGPTPPGCVLVAVVGAHLSGQPLNRQLTDRGARLKRATKTASDYRLYALRGTDPPKPGLIRSPEFKGPGIDVEVWAMPTDLFGSFVASVPPPLAIGTVELADCTPVKGFLCEPFATLDAVEITQLGGWRPYLEKCPG